MFFFVVMRYTDMINRPRIGNGGSAILVGSPHGEVDERSGVHYEGILEVYYVVVKSLAGETNEGSNRAWSSAIA